MRSEELLRQSTQMPPYEWQVPPRATPTHLWRYPEQELTKSKTSMGTFLRPWNCCACRAAMATVPKTQKPMGPALTAWWPASQSNSPSQLGMPQPFLKYIKATNNSQVRWQEQPVLEVLDLAQHFLRETVIMLRYVHPTSFRWYVFLCTCKNPPASCRVDFTHIRPPMLHLCRPHRAACR